MQTLDQYNFSGKRAVVRVDFNVPLDKDFTITDDTRIRAATPTIRKILADGGSVVLLSHLGRPKGGPENKYSLKHLVARLSQEYGTEVQFAEDALQARSRPRPCSPARFCWLKTCASTARRKKATPRLPKSWPPSATCT
jgi:phosphoglycerate kinase